MRIRTDVDADRTLGRVGVRAVAPENETRSIYARGAKTFLKLIRTPFCTSAFAVIPASASAAWQAGRL